MTAIHIPVTWHHYIETAPCLYLVVYHKSILPISFRITLPELGYTIFSSLSYYSNWVTLYDCSQFQWCNPVWYGWNDLCQTTTKYKPNIWCAAHHINYLNSLLCLVVVWYWFISSIAFRVTSHITVTHPDYSKENQNNISKYLLFHYYMDLLPDT